MFRWGCGMRNAEYKDGDRVLDLKSGLRFLGPLLPALGQAEGLYSRSRGLPTSSTIFSLLIHQA